MITYTYLFVNTEQTLSLCLVKLCFFESDSCVIASSNSLSLLNSGRTVMDSQDTLIANV